MRYLPCWKQIGISQDRYRELLHFCRQYPEWKTEVSMAAERREKLIEKIAIVDDCAREIEGGVWYSAIIQNVCIGKSYTQMDRALMPTSDANAFFRRRREFFDILNKRKTD